MSRSRAERREELIQAALRVMKRDGVSAATTRAITAEAGLPHGAFHYCFESKTQLFEAILLKDRLDAGAFAFPAVGEGDTLYDVIASALTGYWEDVVAPDPEEQLVILELTLAALREPQFIESAAGNARASRHQLEDALRRVAAATGAELPLDAEAVASYMFASMIGIILSWLLSRDDQAARTSLALLAAGLSSGVDSATRPV
ncbi:TetR/AcrR family transcriptional regulator [Gordonia paraffinivorans]|uniref:TetR/AcrR family transcriptional regulator n=1 Tax=Gordonia paraffinivorans TaxID=175628 RepID=UPI0024305BAB|nr:TetR/AcrR family transcriptional regulator [Gordonia paraffinivorans]